MSMSIGAAGTRSIAPAYDPAAAAKVQAAVAALHATPDGRELADWLAASRIDIQVVPDAAFQGEYPGAGAVYDARSRQITIPQGLLDRPELVTTLAHEGTHAKDFAGRGRWGAQAFGMIGGTAKDAGAALVTLHNPVTAWLDSLTARQNEDEVHAYHVQAQVASELGRNEGSWALGQAADGAVLSEDDTRTRIASDDLYRMTPGNRAILGGGLALSVTSLAALAADRLGARSWPVYAIGGALAAAWVGADQVRAHRLAAG
jgi:hypothetical protein